LGSPTSHWYPTLEMTCFSLLLFIFFKCIFIVRRRFHLGNLVLYILCFNQITPHYLFILYHHDSLIINLQYSALYYIHTEMGYFNIFHSLTFSLSLPLPIIPSNRLTNTISFSLSLYICVFIYIYDYICISVYI
jgi:hypothetical protein